MEGVRITPEGLLALAGEPPGREVFCLLMYGLRAAADFLSIRQNPRSFSLFLSICVSCMAGVFVLPYVDVGGIEK